MQFAMAVAVLLSLILSLYFTEAAETQPYANSSQYTEGVLGSYLLQDFQTVDLLVPQINQIQQDGRCSNDLYTFLTPHLSVNGLSSMQATILDNEGYLIWTTEWNKKSIYNLMVQTYKGEKVLTFWAGETSSGLGSGTYYILDSTYSVVRTVGGTLNGVDVDLHEFLMTPDDTVLVTAYVPVNYTYDSPDNVTTRLIWDCLVQEIDLDTGEPIFQWSAAEHVKYEDTYIDRQVQSSSDKSEASDWFHVNSIDKDLRGNYLVSSCFTFSLYYIDGATGEILWILGGKRNMFEDKSKGRATSFSGQHYARWADSYTTITLFNNDISVHDPQPRGVRLAIDQDAMTAEVIQEYRNPWATRADTQGSMQDLPGGNVLLGFGSTPAYTEFSHEGYPLCETHFAPASSFDLGYLKSYRVLKFSWHGYPTYAPTLRVAYDSIKSAWYGYASWNGATEVRMWVFQEAVAIDVDEVAWKTIETKPKTGFETKLAVKSGHTSYFRVKAIDEDGDVLGISGVVNIPYAMGYSAHSVDIPKVDSALAWVLVGIIGSSVLATVAAMVRTKYTSQYNRLSKKNENESVENIDDMS